MNPYAFALIRCAVWTAAALRAYQAPPLVEAAPPEATAARFAHRFMEAWLLMWGPSLAPDEWEAHLENLHQAMPDEEHLTSQRPKRPKRCEHCGRASSQL